MVVYKTDPKNLPPPDIQPWEVVFTRKVPATTASDGGYVDTGIVYDPAYEYYMAGALVLNPSPAITTPQVITAIMAGIETIRAIYRPDGVTAIELLDTNGLFINARQSPPAIGATPVDTTAFVMGGDAHMRLDSAGKFWSNWIKDVASDGHFVVARRRRYG
jgi:hypothetical protein